MMTEFERATQHFAAKTEAGTFAHLFVTHKGKMSVEYNKTKEQNDEARFFCKNVVPMMGGAGNISLQISVSSNGDVETLYGGK